MSDRLGPNTLDAGFHVPLGARVYGAAGDGRIESILRKISTSRS